MGQTLTHGVYLPDEGERNCYNGLAANWSILDGAVGTIAEHTTALSGKAPLVHTHVKADITDFPAYGNTAGTICEGNDSRLSDARTPVAHTHGKADVTDLFNSANTWSANNEYKYLIGLSGAEIWFKQPNIEDITTNPSANTSKSILQIWNRATTQYCGGIIDGLMADGTHKLAISCFGFPLNNYGGYYPHSFSFEAKRDGTASFSPNYTNASLGTSTNKWKSLNGINPGALSLPRGYTEEGADKDYIDIASVIQTLDGTLYNYTMPDNGWICLRAEQAQQVHVTLSTWYFGQSVSHPTGSTLIVSVPFRKNDQISLRVKAVTLQYARFYPMQGNV